MWQPPDAEGREIVLLCNFHKKYSLANTLILAHQYQTSNVQNNNIINLCLLVVLRCCNSLLKQEKKVIQALSQCYPALSLAT